MPFKIPSLSPQLTKLSSVITATQAATHRAYNSATRKSVLPVDDNTSLAFCIRFTNSPVCSSWQKGVNSRKLGPIFERPRWDINDRTKEYRTAPKVFSRRPRSSVLSCKFRMKVKACREPRSASVGRDSVADDIAALTIAPEIIASIACPSSFCVLGSIPSVFQRRRSPSQYPSSMRIYSVQSSIDSGFIRRPR
ncbi:hypothetical protein AG1IA_00840 [Rhizoctonia solani AG-1 IA]|uniref:Uncharacterized protein n=1 Tax=Thanatephorus cucumeris (strain AG1-IA) TaxID=983506 RepID=L8X900_THACA|nr:hypothetical protein AG1IA_00840 [Rhizoctonia solani AG-1 IA]